MKRRDFVRTALAAGLAPGLLTPPATAEPIRPRSGAARKKPRIMFYHDSRHPLMYMYEPPIRKQEVEAAVDELVETSVEVLNFCLADGRTVFHDTKVGEVFGQHVRKWPHVVFQRAQQNASSLLEAGLDQLEVLCERAHEKGMLLYPALLVNQGRRGSREEDVRSSLFRLDNQHLEIGAGGDLDPEFAGLTSLDFKHPEVREERFALIEEVLRNYPVDGFELTLAYQSPSPHFFHPDEVEAGRPLMTAWIERIHRTLKETGQDRELAIRVPGDLDTCLGLGLDVREWMRQGIVDVIIGETFGVYWGRVDHAADYRPLLEAARGTSTRVFAVLNSMVDSDRLSNGSIEVIRAAACNYWDQGVDGIYLNQWFQGANWPYRAAFYEQLREIPHPDIMAPKDKLYLVPTAGSYRSPPWEPGMPLPRQLAQGQRLRLELPVSDDLPFWNRVNRVHEVLLRFRVMNTNQLDRLVFRLNGQTLPDSGLRKINQLYRMSTPNRGGGFGYWFVYRLDASHWPRKGKNEVEVLLEHRDATVIPEILLHDVELEIRYLMGRNYHRNEDPDLGPSLPLRDTVLHRS
ncbi:MAG: hypothetical protein F4X19_02615 [Acidobacteria bacterium]|nr:hypothetical protein [Acidobacteriota bacterium]